MANCTALEGILKSCDNNIGGIRTVWLWDMEDQNSIGENTTNWEITSLDVTGTSSPASFQGEEFQFIRNGSNYTEEATIDLANGSTFTTVNLNLMFTRREADKSKSIMLLAEGQRYLGGLVLDSNGIYWVFQDLQLSASTEGSGQAKADGSKYNVTLMAEVANFAKVIDDSISPNPITQLLTTGQF
jgi:hypothetical protein